MINVDNSDLKLKPGMTANTSIIITRHTNALRVANSALRFRPPEGLPTVAVAEQAQPGAAAAAPAAPAKELSPDERRRAMREIMQEAGYSFGSGPPSPEVIQKMQELAKAKGIELPERISAEAGGPRAADAPVYRTVYRIPAGAGPDAPLEQLRVRIGITDGANTELLTNALKEGDVLVTGVNLPSSSAAGGAPPFGGGGGRGVPGVPGMGRF